MARWYNQGVLGGMTGELYDSFQSESGFGRYDIMLIPRPSKEGSLPAMVLEFKFYNEKIHHYGFAFKGKEVLIGE